MLSRLNIVVLTVMLLTAIAVPMSAIAAEPAVSIDESLYSLYHHRADVTISIVEPPAGALLQVSLLGKGSEIETKTAQGPLPAKKYISFSMADRPAGCYVVKAQLVQDGKVITTDVSDPLPYNPNPRIGFDSDGFMLVDGKRYFPVGMYTLQDKQGKDHDAVLREARRAGFNTTVFYAYTLDTVKPLLDAAARNGIKAFVYPSIPPSVRKEQLTRTQMVEDIKARANHPAVLGWYVIDEPEGIGKGSVEVVRDMYRTVKEADTEHPCSLVIMSGEAAAKYHSCTDVMWIDPYPIPYRPASSVADYTDSARKAIERDKPLWVVPQAFDWHVWKEGNIDGVHRPTPDEERCMTYLALVHGAKGIIYWAHTASKYYIRDYPEHWTAMKKIAGELKELTPALLTNSIPDAVTTDAPSVDTMVKRVGGETYVFAVNRDPKECSGSFRLAGVGSADVEVVFEGRTVKASSGAWQDSFRPLDTHVYRIK